ncbi:MAG: polysaccharide lyase [Halococcoides sp.]
MDPNASSTRLSAEITRRTLLLTGGAGLGAVLSGQTLAADPIVLHRDFEELSPGDWTVDESQWNGLNPWSVDTTFVDVVDLDGRIALDTQYPAGEAGNGNGGVDMMVPLGRHYDELYLGYRVTFGAGFEFSNAGGKLPGLIGSADGVYAVTGGDDPDGENGWSARMMWRDPPDEDLDRGGLVMFYVYHPDQPGEYGENMFWDDGPSGQVYFERDTAHEIEHRIVTNTPGESDGVLEGWFDGEKAFERRDLRFWDVPDRGINRFYLSSFFGGGNTPKWAHSRDEHIYYDEFVISTEPIWNGSDRETTATPALDPIDGTVPEDPDGDGLYEDINANGKVDFPDVNLFFQHSDTAAVQDHVEAYDFTDDGAVDLQDVLALFEMV